MQSLKRLTQTIAATAFLTATGVAPFSAFAPSANLVIAAEAPAASVPADKAILQYVDDDTFIVGRLDAEKVDHDELQKMLERMLDSMFKKLGVPPAQLGQVKAQAMQSSSQSKQWLTDIAEAGGKHVYILMQTDVGLGSPPVIVVPFENAEDASKIQGVFCRRASKRPSRRFRATR